MRRQCHLTPKCSLVHVGKKKADLFMATAELVVDSLSCKPMIK